VIVLGVADFSSELSTLLTKSCIKSGQISFDSMGISGSLTGLLLSIIACLVYGVQAEEGIDYAVLRQEILSQMNGEPVNNGFRPDRVLMPGTVVPTSTYAAAFVHLAFQCMSTFDHFKQAGGCDGGRIRYAPGTVALVGSIESEKVDSFVLIHSQK
jgi:hypothetical protein